MSNATLLDEWGQMLSREFPKTLGKMHPIHPCVINGQIHYVHEPQLATIDPEYYACLQRLAESHGIGLKPDQRISTSAGQPCRRKRFIPVVMLAMGLSVAQVQAEQINQHLGLIAERAESNYSEAEMETLDDKSPVGWIGGLEDRVLIGTIERILLSHLEDTASFPASIGRDIEELSIYYARYPEAVALLVSIANAEWTLRYAPHTFQTSVSGSRLEIERVNVFFDPRSAARLKFHDKCKTQKPFCVASPADALLHELLHVQSITLNTTDFIREGGLNPTGYPVEHERRTIEKENQLYRSMTAVDGQARPIRNEHSGRHLLVSCAICLE